MRADWFDIMDVSGKVESEEFTWVIEKCNLFKTFINKILGISLKIPPKNDNFVGCNMAAKVLHISVKAPVKSVRGGYYLA